MSLKANKFSRQRPLPRNEEGYLYGKNSVLERLKANPKTIQKIFIQNNLNLSSIQKLAGKNKIPLQPLSKDSLYKIKRVSSLQGVVAKVSPFSYSDFDQLLEKSKDNSFSFIFLDRIFDPQNLGAILRVVACFGKFAVVIPKHKACSVTDAVLHVASGAENYVPVARVTNLRNCLLEAKKSDFWAVGAVVGAETDIRDLDMPKKVVLVLGSEGEGVRYGLDKHLDFKVSIPMPGAPISFNVTSACAILCYEIFRKLG